MALSVNVSVFGTSDMGVLWRMVLTLKAVTTTVSGCLPLLTPYRSAEPVTSFSMATAEIEPTALPPSIITALTEIGGETCAAAEFCKSKVTTHVAPAPRPGAAVVSTS